MSPHWVSFLGLNIVYAFLYGGMVTYDLFFAGKKSSASHSESFNTDGVGLESEGLDLAIVDESDDGKGYVSRRATDLLPSDASEGGPSAEASPSSAESSSVTSPERYATVAGEQEEVDIDLPEDEDYLELLEIQDRMLAVKSFGQDDLSSDDFSTMMAQPLEAQLNFYRAIVTPQ